ncbi:hypothetical protein GCK72_009605 [Caenorhabditis remanei]|uniref:DUF7107 domain-containing protein n=1 Tax=Caenorhabditis remanei TaxID=31234 RepID=A0A6A5H2Z4_CAERE|nr:hypothetical protein GCK72_009605 [Caenorhabditis remanei]KAF1761349.1 hypothetical protein GCK72_009605 [Caenorhabditis remanei]
MKNLLIVSVLIVGALCHGFLGDDGQVCSDANDCVSRFCFNGKCVTPPRRSYTGIVGHSAMPACGGRCSLGELCAHGECVSSSSIPIRRFSSAKPKLCSTIIDCGSSQLCVDGKCVVDNGHGGLCSSDAYCPNGFICIDGKCSESRRRFSSAEPKPCSTIACLNRDNRRRFSLPCTAPCGPGQRCINGVCVGIDMLHNGWY